MGEVYRARDRVPGRDAAVKVLTARLSSDPAFRGRFEREARAVVMVRRGLAAGDRDSALTWLEHSCENRASQGVALAVYPFLDPPREEPRFRESLRKSGLER